MSEGLPDKMPHRIPENMDEKRRQDVSLLHAVYRSATHISAFRAGQTWPFREKLEQAGIFGARDEACDEYLRVLPQMNVGEDAGRKWILKTVLDEVLRGLVLQLHLTTPPPEASPAAEFLNMLLDSPQIHLKMNAILAWASG